MSILSYLNYPPIARGLLVLLIAGTTFPLAGVFVLRLNLITLRFMLMHGTLLGGAIALGFGFDPLYAGLAVNALLIVFIARLNRRVGANLGHITTFFMVITVGLAFAVMYRTGVPAKDTLAILWGNLYAMDRWDVLVTLLFCLVTVFFVVVGFRRLVAVMFDREVAFSTGINDRAAYNLILLLTGLTIAFAMRLIGALLLDAILLLPAILAGYFAKSMKGMFFFAAGFGLFSGAAGFFLSLAIDIPASSGVTIVAAAILGLTLLVRRGTQ
jgi:zinc transport system permease protein